MGYILGGVGHLGSAVASSMHLTNQGETSDNTTSTTTVDPLQNTFKMDQTPDTSQIYYQVK